MFGLNGDAVDLVLQLRWVNAALGAVTVVVCFLLVRRLAGMLPATIAALVLATDPFVLRLDAHQVRTLMDCLLACAGLVLLWGAFVLPRS